MSAAAPPDGDGRAVHLLVLAKHPLPGRSKTRLCPPLSPLQAADVAAAALADTLDAARGAGCRRVTLVTTDPARAVAPAGVHRLPQAGGGLDVRLAAAFRDAATAAAADGVPHLPLLLVGMDTPQVTAALLARAADALLAPGTDAVLGPAADGGWWALGLRRPDAALLVGVPMSTPRTHAAQSARLRDAGLRVAALERLVDVDTATDLAAVAAAAPGTRTAALARDLGVVPEEVLR